ncbi:putative GTP-binding protein 6 [Drosophila sechellia]|uniref:GM10247 n=1 Tax=Drosophila sechellia TaxID=7238 RepID=B4ICA1_DROSE|nr:putative GTP-binding protein 6 [Drosophila sechellia]EDW44997.1 GM10247 [Drosophila sechellia]
MSALRIFARLVRSRTLRLCPILEIPARCKYTQHQGVKGIRNRKSFYEAQIQAGQQGEEDEDLERTASSDLADMRFLDDRAYDEVAGGAMRITRDIASSQQVLILQPYVKWAAKRQSGPLDVRPEDQLAEASALIHSLPNWQVARALKVPLESLEKKTLFGSGKLVELKELVAELRQERHLTCLFVSKGTLSFAQKRFLEAEFRLPVMDRYSVVIQILRLHATSAEAKLQVAMAELPYIWAQAKDASVTQTRRQGYALTDLQKEILRTRERKLRTELDRVRRQRQLLRQKRKQQNYPIVAVVGYTNAGKTSLIKALTVEDALQPRNQLFATLDVTAHAGCLPCNLEVIYMDTVGFMSDLPTGLFECFVATLEDAMLADVIVHVQDLSHPCHAAQRSHVEATLRSLAFNVAGGDSTASQLPPIINVYNKCDLVSQEAQSSSDPVHHISARAQTGLEPLLDDIEQQILTATGRRKLQMRVPSGGPEMAWLYKNAAVVETTADAENPERLMMHVVISQRTLDQFKRQFCR